MSVKKKILCCLCFLLCGSSTMAQEAGSDTSVILQEDCIFPVRQDTLFFEFKPKRNMFWSGYKRNALFLDSLSHSIRSYKLLIESGELKIRVLGFCSSFDTEKENIFSGKDRSNQVKSYFITKSGLKEEYFYTTNFISRWKGMSDVVAVTYLPLETTPTDTLTKETISTPDSLQTTDKLEPEPEITASDTLLPPDSLANAQTGQPESTETIAQLLQGELTDPEYSYYRWGIKTNVAYLAATVANLGVEYSFGKHYSVDVPVIYSPYTVARSYRLRFLAVQPEFRYWLKYPTKGHFFGVHLNIGAFNIALDKKKRYQSPDGFYGAGISYGYVLLFAKHWAAEFMLGAGYIHTKYDTYYNIPNGARFEKGISYNYWGLTKVGISLVYRFGK